MKKSIQVLGPGPAIYVRCIALSPRTIYPTHVSFTSDKQFAAIFENKDALIDALDAMKLFCRGETITVSAHRNTLGMHYVDFT